MQALLYATQLLTMLPSLLAAGKNVVELVETGNAALKAMADENREPTPDEWDALNARIKALQKELHAP